MSISAPLAISTPCINICQIDHISRLCVGCGRTRDEIGGWSLLSEAARREIMQTLPERLKSAWRERTRIAREQRRGSL